MDSRRLDGRRLVKRNRGGSSFVMAATVVHAQLGLGALGLGPSTGFFSLGRSVRVGEARGTRGLRDRSPLIVRAAASRSYKAAAASGAVNSQKGPGNLLLNRLTGNGAGFAPATGSMEELELELGVCIPFKKYTPEGVSLCSFTQLKLNNIGAMLGLSVK